MYIRRSIAILALTGALAGCGGGSSGSAPTAVGAPTTGPDSPAATAPAAQPAAPTQEAVAPEDNPPGDIPDDLAFVRYTNAAGHYSFTHPEGWAETEKAGTVTFTDKLNGVHIEVGNATAAPTVATAKSDDVPVLTSSQPAFELVGVSAVREKAGAGVRIVYRRNSEPDPVTGRQYRDEVERYELFAGGRDIIVELYGPIGADNVDAYRTMIDSLKLS